MSNETTMSVLPGNTLSLAGFDEVCDNVGWKGSSGKEGSL
jgi:hypothetical protein